MRNGLDKRAYDTNKKERKKCCAVQKSGSCTTTATIQTQRTFWASTIAPIDYMENYIGQLVHYSSTIQTS